MMETLFYQNNGTITQFEGEIIASVTSALPSKDRHTDFDLFLSKDNEWILQGVGRTKIPTESDRYWCVVSYDVSDVLQSILGSDVSRLAKRLLSEALQNLAVGDDNGV